MHANVAGKKVAILVHNYFEQDEFEEPLTALKDAGVITTVITANDDLLLFGMHHADVGGKFQADILLSEADPDDYDGLVLPGGVINADALRVVEDAQDWAVDFLDSGKPVAVICHAPWLLVSADAVEGRRLTSYFTLQDDIQNAGGEWVDQAVVVDDNLITSRKPDDLPAFCEAILNMLSEEPPSLRGETYGEDKSPPLNEHAVEDLDELHPSGVIPLDERDDNT
jgi:protease I